ncbi:hypothetical protein ES703_75434 [subsurface metagenome]
MNKEMEDRDGKGRFVKGNKAAQVHGAYPIKDGEEMPFTEEREAIEKRLDGLRLSLEEQFPKKNMKTELLIRDVVRLEATIAHLELYLYKAGSPVDMNRFRKRNIAEVQPCMREFLQCITMKRHALLALGIEKDGRKAMTPLEKATEFDGARGEE